MRKKQPVRTRKSELLSTDMAQVYELMEASPIGMGISRLSDGYILYSNQHAADLFGVPKNQLVGSSGRKLWVNQDQRNEFLAEFERTGSVEAREVQLLKGGADPFWCILSWKPTQIINESCFVFWCYDISAQKSVEQKLRNSESRMNHFVNTASDWFWELDENLCVTAISPGYLKLTRG